MFLLIFLWILSVRVMLPVDIGGFSKCLSCANLLYVSQLTQTGKIVEFFGHRFFVFYLNKGKLINVRGFLDLKDSLYNFCNMTRLESESTTLFSHTDERSRTWHE
jgi:hypothetical protein